IAVVIGMDTLRNPVIPAARRTLSPAREARSRVDLRAESLRSLIGAQTGNLLPDAHVFFKQALPRGAGDTRISLGADRSVPASRHDAVPVEIELRIVLRAQAPPGGVGFAEVPRATHQKHHRMPDHLPGTPILLPSDTIETRIPIESLDH